MREIKFRAWDIEKEEMAKVISIGGEDITMQDDEGRIWDSVTGYTAYPMQYSGSKDKNGVEIYEGDVFHLGDPNITYTVIWADTGLKGKQNKSSSYVGISHWADVIEVVGNVYETAEFNKYR